MIFCKKKIYLVFFVETNDDKNALFIWKKNKKGISKTKCEGNVRQFRMKMQFIYFNVTVCFEKEEYL